MGSQSLELTLEQILEVLRLSPLITGQGMLSLGASTPAALEPSLGAAIGVSAAASPLDHRHALPTPELTMMNSPIFMSNSLTFVRTVGAGGTLALYMGIAPQTVTAVQMRYRISTPANGVTWAEIGVAKGPPNFGANPTLTPVGFLDIAGDVTIAAQYSKTIAIAGGQVLEAGDGVWLLFGADTTIQQPIVRAQSLPDDLQAGYSAERPTHRPSLNIGVPSEYTKDAATGTIPWFTLGI
jgi:hypothetical protein